jgi:hypothetical protein
MQALCQQLWSAGHVLPHLPQLTWLPVMSTHAAPHLVSPAAQPAPQAPLEQTWLAGQTVPHLPQLLGSD